MGSTRTRNGKPVEKDEKKSSPAGANRAKAAGTITPGGAAAPRTPAPASQLGTGGEKVATQGVQATTTKSANLVKGPQALDSGQPVQQKTVETRRTSPARYSTESQSRSLEHVVPALQETNFGPEEEDENGCPLYNSPGYIASIVQQAKKREEELIAAGINVHQGNNAKLPVHPKQAA